MRSVERRFAEFQKASKGHSSFVVFGRTIKGQGFTKVSLGKWFNRLVDKGDFCLSDKRRILKHIWALNMTVDTQKQGSKGSRSRGKLIPSPYSTFA